MSKLSEGINGYSIHTLPLTDIELHDGNALGSVCLNASEVYNPGDCDAVANSSCPSGALSERHGAPNATFEYDDDKITLFGRDSIMGR